MLAQYEAVHALFVGELNPRKLLSEKQEDQGTVGIDQFACGVVLVVAGLNRTFHCVVVSAFCQEWKVYNKVGLGEVEPQK